MSGRQTRVDTAPRCGEREVTPGRPNGGSLADQRGARYILQNFRLVPGGRLPDVGRYLRCWLALDTGYTAVPQLAAYYSLNHTDGSWALWQMISLAPNMTRLILDSTSTTTCPFQHCGFPQTRIHMPAPSTSSPPPTGPRSRPSGLSPRWVQASEAASLMVGCSSSKPGPGDEI